MIGERNVMGPDPILEELFALDGVEFSYPGTIIPAITGCSLHLRPGRRTALVGENGSGKSTLLRLLNGLLRPAAGEIQFGGAPLDYSRKGLRSLRQAVGLVFQDPDDQLFAATVAEDIGIGPRNLGLGVADVASRVRSAARQVAVEALLDRPIHALSFGQKARVAIAGILAMQPRVILADEALASLDGRTQRGLLELFSDLVAGGVSVILATHDLEVAYGWADDVIVLADGRLLAAGSPEDVFADADLLAGLGWEAPWPVAIYEALGASDHAPRDRAAVLEDIRSAARSPKRDGLGSIGLNFNAAR